MPALAFLVSTFRYIRFGSLAAIAIPRRANPSSAVGNPFVIGFHVEPPSIDLYNPLPGIRNDSPLRTSHGATRAAHNAANKISELPGSITISAAPVFSSLYKTFSNVFPPSSDRKTPRSAFGPYG